MHALAFPMTDKTVSKGFAVHTTSSGVSIRYLEGVKHGLLTTTKDPRHCLHLLLMGER